MAEDAPPSSLRFTRAAVPRETTELWADPAVSAQVDLAVNHATQVFGGLLPEGQLEHLRHTVRDALLLHPEVSRVVSNALRPQSAQLDGDCVDEDVNDDHSEGAVG